MKMKPCLACNRKGTTSHLEGIGKPYRVDHEKGVQIGRFRDWRVVTHFCRHCGGRRVVPAESVAAIVDQVAPFMERNKPKRRPAVATVTPLSGGSN